MDCYLTAERLSVLGFGNVQKVQDPMLRKHALDLGFTFDVVIDNIRLHLLIGFDKHFPLSLPVYHITDYDQQPHMPHIGDDGKICYYLDDYLYMDAERIDDILIETRELACETVRKGLTRENWMDFTNEFEDYWNKLDKTESVWFNCLVAEQACIVKMAVREKTKLLVSDQNEFLQSPKRFFGTSEGGFTMHNALYIPLDGSQVILPPRNLASLNMDYVRNLIATHAFKGTDKLLLRLLSGKPAKEEYVFFSIRTITGIPAVFGIKFSNIAGDEHPLITYDPAVRIIPVSIVRIDKEYVFKRGSNGIKYEQRGLIIGAGSVGGFVAENLVRTGFFNVTIADADQLTPENCYRHTVGFPDIGINKAIAVKGYLEEKFPHCKIEAEKRNIEDLLKDKVFTLSAYDFIIVATGNVTVNMHLNKWVYEQKFAMPVFYCWNDPYGIGGHCLVTLPGTPGCYSCLYANELKSNTASFADAQQSKSFLKAASGCGGFFTPYGAMDSVQTAVLVSRKVVDVLTGKETKSAVYSWKGNADLFLEEGCVLSKRYLEFTEPELYNARHAFVHPKCRICR